jgi:hypothetical protein
VGEVHGDMESKEMLKFMRSYGYNIEVWTQVDCEGACSLDGEKLYKAHEDAAQGIRYRKFMTTYVGKFIINSKFVNAKGLLYLILSKGKGKDIPVTGHGGP